MIIILTLCPGLLPGAWLSAQASTWPPSLEEIPRPDLTQLEDAVKEQLSAARQILDEQLASPRDDPRSLAESLGEMGRHYHAYDFKAAAKACYRNALSLVSSGFRWTYLLANLLQSEGDLEWAGYFYQRARLLRPEDVPATVHLAEVRQQQGMDELAESLFREALKMDPSCGAAHFGLGQLELSRREHAKAVEHFERALELVPGATQIHYPLGLAYRGLGQLDKAQFHLARRGEAGVRVADPLLEELEQLKRGEIVYLQMGRRAYDGGDLTAAKRYYEMAVNAAPDSFRALTNLGTVLAQLGDEQAAIEHFEAAAAAGSESTALYYNLAVLLNRAGRHREAAKRLEFILDREPGDQPARVELARALRALNQYGAALEQLRRAVQLKPEDADARFEQAVVLVDLSRYREALELLSRSRELFPQDGRITHALARLLAAAPDRSLRDGQKALSLALALFKSHPSPEYGETVSMAYAELGQCTQAFYWQQQLIAKADNSGQEKLAARLREALERYSGQPCRP